MKEEEEQRRKKGELGVERDGSHIKMRPEGKTITAWEKVEKERGQEEEEEGSKGQSVDKKESAQGHICIFKIDIFS